MRVWGILFGEQKFLCVEICQMVMMLKIAHVKQSLMMVYLGIFSTTYDRQKNPICFRSNNFYYPSNSEAKQLGHLGEIFQPEGLLCLMVSHHRSFIILALVTFCSWCQIANSCFFNGWFWELFGFNSKNCCTITVNCCILSGIDTTKKHFTL